MIGTSLDHEEEAEFVNLLRKNIDFFCMATVKYAWDRS